MQPAILVENISKLYHLGAVRRRHLLPGTYHSLREAVTGAVTASWRRLCRRLAPSSSPSDNGHPEPDNRKSGGSTIWALKDVSFEVKPGELVGIIGANGSGKSTLLKVLSGIVEPTTGRATIRGRVGNLLEVGTGFHPELTGRENIYLNGSILGMSRREIDQRFDEIVAFSEIERFLDTPVKRYSSGMYVRLAFAVAAHLRTEILLADEVLAVGDTAFQKKCLGKMGQVAHGGKTVLFVSHDMNTVHQLCQRTLLLVSGRLASQGPTDAVIGKYLRSTSYNEDGVFDLSNHPARLPECDVIFKRLSLRTSDGQPTSVFYSDDGLEAELTLDPPTPLLQPVVFLSIEDSLANRITTICTGFKQGLGDLHGPCRIKFTIPELRLGTGQYLLTFSVSSKDFRKMYDGLLNVARFEVIWRQGHGNGDPYYPVFGPVLTPSTWQKLD